MNTGPAAVRSFERSFVYIMLDFGRKKQQARRRIPSNLYRGPVEEIISRSISSPERPAMHPIV